MAIVGSTFFAIGCTDDNEDEKRTAVAVGEITLQVTPEYISSNDDSVACLIHVHKTTGEGIPGVSVTMASEFGVFAAPPVTDAAGRTSTYWFANGHTGTARIWASAGDKSDTAQVTVETSSSPTGTLTISTDRQVLNADGCISQAIVRTSLVDEYGSAVSGDTIYFGTSNGGAIVAFGVTDTLGSVYTTLCGGATPNSADPTDSATVVARYPRWGLTDSLRFRINPAAQVESVILTAQRYAGIAGVDSIELAVFAIFENGFRVSGMPAYIHAECGNVPDSVMLAIGNFVDNVYWQTCYVTNPPSDPFEIFVIVGGVESNHIQMTVDPGPARHVNLVAQQNVVPIRESVDLFAQVYDFYGNPVRAGVAVMFSATSGLLTPTSPVETDIEGIARVALNVGVIAGPITVQAAIGDVDIDSTVISVITSGFAYIHLSLDPPNIEVAGSGGRSSATIRADVRDEIGNPGPDGVWLTFEILGGFPGGGININGHGFIDSVQTANGTALATLNAGTNTGPFSLQARVYWDGMEIRSNYSGGSVVAGPPAILNIGISEIARDLGSAWELQVSALVQDNRNNAVRCSIAVFFELEPEGVAQITSQNVFTCNEDTNGNASLGIAHTTLRYNSPETFQPIVITASIGGPGGVSGSREFVLPLQSPTFDITATPIAWHYPSEGDPSQIRVTATLVDGHYTRINGGRVIFTTPRGEFYTAPVGGTRIQVDGALDRRLTGPTAEIPNQEAGQCFAWLRCFEANAFASPLETERTCEVHAEVEGYGFAEDAVVVRFQR